MVGWLIEAAEATLAFSVLRRAVCEGAEFGRASRDGMWRRVATVAPPVGGRCTRLPAANAIADVVLLYCSSSGVVVRCFFIKMRCVARQEGRLGLNRGEK